jgi:hypothetical protein
MVRQNPNLTISCRFLMFCAPVAAPKPVLRGVNRAGSIEPFGRICEL